MKTMAQLLRNGHAAANIMDAIRRDELRSKMLAAGRNVPCPCGSGRKSKKCCEPSQAANRREIGDVD